MDVYLKILFLIIIILYTFHMKGFYQLILSILLLLSFISIETVASSLDYIQPFTSKSMQENEEEFPFPEIPSSLQTPQERMEYLLNHYWERFDFSNQPLLENKTITEQGFVNFVALLADSPVEDALTQVAINNFCQRMTLLPKARNLFLSMAEDYLFNPQSPLLNETLYACILYTVRTNKRILSKAERQRIDYMLSLIERNNPGQKASDFTYYSTNGKKKKFSNTKVLGTHLILYFYDPECLQCRETLMQMKADDRLFKAVNTGKLTVLAIYTERDEQVWKNSQSQLPSQWIVGSDCGFIKEKALYDLKSMPSLYLLDNKRRVIVKNGSWEEICEGVGF